MIPKYLINENDVLKKSGVNGISNNLIFILAVYEGLYKISYLNYAMLDQSHVLVSNC